MDALLKEVRQIHWQHILGFMLIIIPVGTWMQHVHSCGQRTIIEVCK